MVTDIRHNNIPPGWFVEKNGSIVHISERMLRKIRGKLAATVDISPQDKDRLFAKFRELRSLCPKSTTG